MKEISGVRIEKNGKVLSLHKIKRDHWELPGGKIDSEETPEQTAIREAKEETGCDVNIESYRGYVDVNTGKGMVRSHQFDANITKGTPALTEPKVFDNIKWLDSNDLNNKLAKNLRNDLYIGEEGSRLHIRVENPTGIGLAICMPGLGATKDDVHARAFQTAFLEKDMKVVSFDPRDSFGKSEGDYENATTSSYYTDLCEVIDWVKKQDWCEEPFILLGHSLGGICTATYAARNSNEVKAVAPLATVVSRAMSLDDTPKHLLEEWEKTGYRTHESKSKPGLIKQQKWKPYKEDGLKYDLRKEASKLTMPVLLIVGEKDEPCPVSHQKVFFELLDGEKELHIIEGADHGYRPHDKNLKNVKEIIRKWVDKL